ncbi:agmatine deiminase [Parasphingorhabdus marina DSM 22363]|uniref:Agmatine deiminase n=1 Tax=Parasphingorhabdus marina DSM 22363 TaxID=1123272 RepID=A0A1N6GBT2_9SPHN|nr:agmatine deiminase [Parasphingorhabdus marina DSM 22363]
MRWPAEWERHEAVWIGFPGNPAEWPEMLKEAQREVAAFADAVSDDGKGEQVLLVCRDQQDARTARSLTSDRVQPVIEPFGDIWLRDTGPVITIDEGKLLANDFGFNGWGRQFEMAGDQDIGSRLAAMRSMPIRKHDWVLEGGAIDGDGTGRLVTTEQCVLNSNRNPGLDRAEAERRLSAALSVRKLCWLGDGLTADHTDGHVDNLARFVAPGTLVIPIGSRPDDPNAAIYDGAAARAETAGLDVRRLPSVGKYLVDGDVAPASYMNFYIGNTVVAIPQYGVPEDSAALENLAAFFPGRKVIGLSSMALLRGGGSFHCISQQIPALD